MRWARTGAAVAVIWLGAVTGTSAQTNVQFSGLAAQSGPDGRTREAKLFVGDNQVRMEHRRDGAEMIEIFDMKHARALLLVPAQMVYMQREVPQGGRNNPMLPPANSNPCTLLKDAHCKKLGSESLYGRSVSKWEVRVAREGKTHGSLHWIDDERHMSLRDVWPDGTVSEQVFEGVENLHGRPTERWVKTTTLTDGKTEVATQWYDPQLQIAIREQLPGGYFREIRDIKIAPQPPRLFQLPAGYRRVENALPTPAQGQRGR